VFLPTNADAGGEDENLANYKNSDFLKWVKFTSECDTRNPDDKE
jgi:hypothetical protein